MILTSALEVLRDDDELYKSTFYLLTYLQNSNFRKLKMADGRQFKKALIAVSQLDV